MPVTKDVSVIVLVTVTVSWIFSNSTSVIVFVKENLQNRDVFVVMMISSSVRVVRHMDAEKRVVGTYVLIIVRF